MTDKGFKLYKWLLFTALLTALGFTQPTAAAAAPPAQTVLMQDSFTDGDYTSNPVWTIASGTWKVSTDPADSSNKSLNQTDAVEGIIMAGDSTWTDSAVSMRFYTGAGGAYPGILARVQDAKNFYYFQMQASNGLVLSKRVGGTTTTLKSVSYPFSKNTWYTLKLALVGSSIKGYIVNNGVDTLALEAVDTSFASGKVGVRNNWQTLYLDDVKVASAPAVNSSVLQADSRTVSSLSLSWTPVEGATGYNLYRSATSGSGYTLVTSTTDTSYTDSWLASDTAYYYKMAYLYGGLTESQWSQELQAVTSPAPPVMPTAPSAVAVNSSTVNISWTAAAKATGYRVYRSNDGGGTFSPIYDGTAVSYNDTGLSANSTYLYKITAYNAYGESAAATAQATTYQYDPPSGFKAASATDTTVQLRWNPSPGSSVVYTVTRSSSSFGTYSQVYTGTSTSFTDGGLTQGTGYFYKIQAVIDGVSSPQSDPLGTATVRTAFTPDQVWADTNGNPIDAHGPGILYDDKTAKYYWYGEYHKGAWPSSGVRVYSSTDLYNWTDEGLALTMVNSMDDFTSDPLISKLYAGRTDTVSIWADIRKGRIIERPKVIYNDKTGKYVMWAHIDGDKDPYNNAANYGKAQAGYAISDSPTGPFVYQRSYRMDQCPPDQTDYQPGNPGMARDMNLFKDDDGTAYLIYSSEENLTIYISKLLDDYSDVTGWHKDGNVDANGNPVRDTSYKGVYGVDYIRVFPGSQREAPAVFKYGGKYYLLTSGATGWSANTNKFSVADRMLGTWSTPANPFVRTTASDPDPAAAFNSQTASVIPVNPAQGKFIYVGDDWNGGNFTSNNGAKYIWLPIEFGQGTDISIKWYASWTKDLLDSMGKMDIQLSLPAVIATGTLPDLPGQVNVVPYGASEAVSTSVTWSVNSAPVTANTFKLPGMYTLQASLPQFNNKTLSFKLYAVPDNTIYFVNSGGYATTDYSLIASYLQDTLVNKDVVEQAYNAGDAVPWGYVGSNTKPAGSGSGDLFSTLRYLNGGNVTNSPAGTDLTYKFTVPNGTYTVYTGFNDIWSNTSRKADLYINGVKKTAVTFISNNVYGYTVDVTNGTIDVTVRNTAAQDPLINWIMIEDKTRSTDPLRGLRTTSVSLNSASLSWNKVLGASSYTLYRAAGTEGTYTPVYNGSATSFTDTGIDLTQSYRYAVTYTGLSGESAMSDPVSVADTASPATEISVTGSLNASGWYTSDVTVTLASTDDLSGVAKTEYKAGAEDDWHTYSAPVALKQDGIYTLSYRSTDRSGNVEQTKQLQLKLDQTPPVYSLFVDGAALKNGQTFDDDQTVTFSVYEAVSGLVSGSISVNNAVYGVDPGAPGSVIVLDFTGRTGSYTAVINARDAAGNQLQQTVQFQVTTSVRAMNQLLARYKAQLGTALYAQLSNSLSQAQQQLDKNRPDQAAKHMQDFLKHLGNTSLNSGLDSKGKATLTADANALIKLWSGM